MDKDFASKTTDRNPIVEGEKQVEEWLAKAILKKTAALAAAIINQVLKDRNEINVTQKELLRELFTKSLRNGVDPQDAINSQLAQIDARTTDGKRISISYKEHRANTNTSVLTLEQRDSVKEGDFGHTAVTSKLINISWSSIRPPQNELEPIWRQRSN